MTGDCHARFCGSPEVRSLRATRPHLDHGQPRTNNFHHPDKLLRTGDDDDGEGDER